MCRRERERGYTRPTLYVSSVSTAMASSAIAIVCARSLSWVGSLCDAMRIAISISGTVCGVLCAVCGVQCASYICICACIHL